MKIPIHLVIMFIGVTMIGSLGGVVLLAANEKSIPDVLVALASGSLGALSSLLVAPGTRGVDQVDQ